MAVGVGISPPADCWKSALWSDPQFFVVPVLNVTTLPPNGSYPIVDFYGFYIDCNTEGPPGPTCGGNLSQGADSPFDDADFKPSSGLTGFAFKLRTPAGLSTISGLPGGGAGVSFFGGAGIPVLTHDLGDPTY
jgi:hypothetical protein